MEARFVQKYSPFKDWDWDKEVQSRILQMLDLISCHIVNTHRKKGAKPVKVGEQFQPDYVKDAKNSARKQRKDQAEIDKQDLAEIFEKRNNKVKKLEERLTDATS